MTSRRPLARGDDPPVALHLEVRVDGQAAVGADQQVLAARDGLGDELAGEVDGRVPGHAEVAAGQHLPGEGSVQALGGGPDDVTFGHGSSLPDCRG